MARCRRRLFFCLGSTARGNPLCHLCQELREEQKIALQLEHLSQPGRQFFQVQNFFLQKQAHKLSFKNDQQTLCKFRSIISSLILPTSTSWFSCWVAAAQLMSVHSLLFLSQTLESSFLATLTGGLESSDNMQPGQEEDFKYQRRSSSTRT